MTSLREAFGDLPPLGCIQTTECTSMVGATPGYYCETCTGGTATDSYSGLEKTKCPAGYACTGGGNKNICGAGTYSGSGAIECTSCPAGTYGDEAGASECISCPIGTYSDIVGCSSGNNCSCQSCPANTYSGSIGATKCTSCPAGKNSDAGSTALSDCTCQCDGEPCVGAGKGCCIAPPRDMDDPIEAGWPGDLSNAEYACLRSCYGTDLEEGERCCDDHQWDFWEVSPSQCNGY